MTRRCPTRWALPLLLSAGLAAGVVGVPGASSGVGAQAPEQGQLIIGSVDTSAFPEVEVNVLSVGETLPLDQVALRENGRVVVRFELAPVPDPRSQVVVLIDASDSMNKDDAIGHARNAVRQFVTERVGNDRIAIVSFSSEPTVHAPLSADTGMLVSAVDAVTAGGRTALWDAVLAGIELFEEVGERHMIILSQWDGSSFDNNSQATFEDARAAVAGADVTVFSIGHATAEADPAVLTELAGGSGVTLATNNPAGWSEIFQQVHSSLQNQYRLRYTSTTSESSLDLLLTAANRRSARAVVPVERATADTGPEVVDDGDTGTVALVIAGIAGALILLVLVLRGRSG